MKITFDHEKLNVYQEAIGFVSWVHGILESVPKGLSVYNQLDRASSSIPLNIAEGNGKFTAPDRCKYFDIARGSVLECAACLDVLFVKKHVKEEKIIQGKKLLMPIISMLTGLIKTTSPNRVYEGDVKYNLDGSD